MNALCSAAKRLPLAWTLAVGTLLVGAGPAAARPVSFVGSTMAMLQSQPMMVSLNAHHTPLRRFSAGLGYAWMARAEGESRLLAPEVNFLAFRHNAMDAQANVFLTAGGGVLERDRNYGGVGFVGAEADAESRRLYSLVAARYTRGVDRFEDFQLMARAGIAPFVGEMDQINPWLVVQYQYMPQFSGRHVITPMLRLLYGAVLLEVGSSLRGEWMLNFSAEL